MASLRFGAFEKKATIRSSASQTSTEPCEVSNLTSMSKGKSGRRKAPTKNGKGTGDVNVKSVSRHIDVPNCPMLVFGPQLEGTHDTNLI